MTDTLYGVLVWIEDGEPNVLHGYFKKTNEKPDMPYWSDEIGLYCNGIGWFKCLLANPPDTEITKDPEFDHNKIAMLTVFNNIEHANIFINGCYMGKAVTRMADLNLITDLGQGFTTYEEYKSFNTYKQF